MSIDKLKFKLWALQQDNLARSERIDRTRSDEHRALLQALYNESEREIEALRAEIKEEQQHE